MRGVVLTGGIASGKSTASNELRKLGFKVVCADEVAHEVLQQNAAQVRDLFGEEVVSGGVINRAKLGQIVFSDKAQLARLEALLHPQIKSKILQISRELEAKNRLYFVDIPLFFEKNDYDFEKSVLIFCDPKLQLRRLMARNGFTREEALKRINAQMPLSQKARLATFVIDNNGDLPHLKTQIQKLVKTLGENDVCKQI